MRRLHKKGNSSPAQPVAVPQTELADMETQSDASTKSPDKENEKRQPAEDQKEKDDLKDKEAKEDKKEQPKDADKNQHKDESRNPSSVGAPQPAQAQLPPPNMPTGSMLLDGDFAGAEVPNVPPVPPSVGGIPIGPAPLPTTALPPKNDFVNEVISGTVKRVNVNLSTGN